MTSALHGVRCPSFWSLYKTTTGFPWWLSGKGVTCQCRGHRFKSLVWEDPTYHGATKPMCCNYWACTLEPESHNYWARMLQLLKPELEPMLHNKRSRCTEKPMHHNQRVAWAAVETQHSQINKTKKQNNKKKKTLKTTTTANYPSIHKQKYLSGSCGIHHQKPRDPGGVSWPMHPVIGRPWYRLWSQ